MLTFNSDIIKSESNCHNKKMPKLFKQLNTNI